MKTLKELYAIVEEKRKAYLKALDEHHLALANYNREYERVYPNKGWTSEGNLV